MGAVRTRQTLYGGVRLDAIRWMNKLRYRGARWALRAMRNRVRPYRVPAHEEWAARFAGAKALEIGGPSPVFERTGMLPIYDGLRQCDNVQFAAETQWQGNVPDGSPIGRGTQLVREAGHLAGVANASYDLVLASHVLEHMANPLGTLREWWRVTAPRGVLIVIVPEGSRMWDHNRPTTSLDHLVADEAASTDEDDLSHLEEVLRLSDWKWFEAPQNATAYLDEFRRNPSTRTMHHHVFDAPLVEACLSRAGWSVSAVHRVWPHHLAAFAHRS